MDHALADSVAREVVVLVALLRGPGERPARILRDRVRRADRDVGVYQRPAAHAACAEDRDSVVVPQAEQALAAERREVVEPILVAPAPHAPCVEIDEPAEVPRRRPQLHGLALLVAQEPVGLDLLVLHRGDGGRPPRPALAHQHPLSLPARLERTRPAERGHRASEPGTDDDDLVVLLRPWHERLLLVEPAGRAGPSRPPARRRGQPPWGMNPVTPNGEAATS